MVRWGWGILGGASVGCAAEITPEDVGVAGVGYRSWELTHPEAGVRTAGFLRLEARVTGLGFTNWLSDRAIAVNRLREIGAGVALGDVDGDGRVDLFLCGSEGGNALYRNLGGFRFEDITASAGVGGAGRYSTGAALVDVEGDGDLDLLVNRLGGGTRLHVNDGRGRFEEATGRGLLSVGGATSMALADVDGDGDLDLYVTNYRTDTMFDHPAGLKLEVRTMPDGTRIIEPRSRVPTLIGADGGPQALERGEPDALYIHRGGGYFHLQSWTSGLFLDEEGRKLAGAPTDWGLAAMFRDLNGDGLPDLDVCNDFVFWPDRVWLNDGGRRFRAIARLALRSTISSGGTAEHASAWARRRDLRGDRVPGGVGGDGLDTGGGLSGCGFGWLGGPVDRGGESA